MTWWGRSKPAATEANNETSRCSSGFPLATVEGLASGNNVPMQATASHFRSQRSQSCKGHNGVRFLMASVRQAAAKKHIAANPMQRELSVTGLSATDDMTLVLATLLHVKDRSLEFSDQRVEQEYHVFLHSNRTVPLAITISLVVLTVIVFFALGKPKTRADVGFGLVTLVMWVLSVAGMAALRIHLNHLLSQRSNVSTDDSDGSSEPDDVGDADRSGSSAVPSHDSSYFTTMLSVFGGRERVAIRRNAWLHEHCVLFTMLGTLPILVWAYWMKGYCWFKDDERRYLYCVNSMQWDGITAIVFPGWSFAFPGSQHTLSSMFALFLAVLIGMRFVPGVGMPEIEFRMFAASVMVFVLSTGGSLAAAYVNEVRRRSEFEDVVRLQLFSMQAATLRNETLQMKSASLPGGASVAVRSVFALRWWHGGLDAYAMCFGVANFASWSTHRAPMESALVLQRFASGLDNIVRSLEAEMNTVPLPQTDSDAADRTAARTLSLNCRLNRGQMLGDEMTVVFGPAFGGIVPKETSPMAGSRGPLIDAVHLQFLFHVVSSFHRMTSTSDLLEHHSTLNNVLARKSEVEVLRSTRVDFKDKSGKSSFLPREWLCDGIETVVGVECGPCSATVSAESAGLAFHGPSVTHAAHAARMLKTRPHLRKQGITVAVGPQLASLVEPHLDADSIDYLAGTRAVKIHPSSWTSYEMGVNESATNNPLVATSTELNQSAEPQLSHGSFVNRSGSLRTSAESMQLKDPFMWLMGTDEMWGAATHGEHNNNNNSSVAAAVVGGEGTLRGVSSLTLEEIERDVGGGGGGGGALLLASVRSLPLQFQQGKKDSAVTLNLDAPADETRRDERNEFSEEQQSLVESEVVYATAEARVVLKLCPLPGYHFADMETEGLFLEIEEETWHRESLRDVVVFSVFAALMSIICIIVCRLYDELEVANRGKPLVWFILSLISALFVVPMRLLLSSTFTVMKAVVHLAMLAFCACYLTGVFVAPPSSVLGNSRVAWLMLLLGALLTRPRWHTPQVMLLLEIAVVVATSLEVIFHFSVTEFAMSKLTIVMFFVACLICLVLLRILWDKADRERFAVTLRIQSVDQNLTKQFLELEEAIVRTAPKGVADDLKKKLRGGHAEEARAKVKFLPYRSTNITTITDDVELLMVHLPVHILSMLSRPNILFSLLDRLERETQRSLDCFPDVHRAKSVPGDAMCFTVRSVGVHGDCELRAAALLNATPRIVGVLDQTCKGLLGCGVKAILLSGPLVGAIVGGHRRSFEYCGGIWSAAHRCLQEAVSYGSLVCTSRFARRALAGIGQLCTPEEETIVCLDDATVVIGPEYVVKVRGCPPMGLCCLHPADDTMRPVPQSQRNAK